MAKRDGDGAPRARLSSTPSETARDAGRSFEALLRGTPDIVYRYRLRPDRAFEFVSPSATEVTGYTPEEHYADPELGLKIAHPDDRRAIERVLSQPGTTLPPSILRWVRKDGRIIWTEQHNVWVLDDRGEAIAIEGIARDITERIEAEEHMRENERALAEAQALAHIGSWDWDVASNVVTWSDELYRIFGLEPHEFPATYEGFLEHVHPDDRAHVEKTIGEAFAGEHSFAFDHRVIRPDGTVRWLHGRGEVIRNARGDIVRMVGTGQDVTERRLAEDSLARSERRFRVTIETAPDAVIGVDPYGLILWGNQQAEELFGYSQDELAGSPLEMLLPQRVRGRHIEHRGAYMADPKTRPMGTGLDLWARRKDGSEFPVDISLSTVDSPEGRIVTAFVRDVTERRRSEEAARVLREAEQRRRQALEINDSVVQGLSAAVYALEVGELRTAVRAIGATLASARKMMADLLAETTQREPLTAGDLVRAEAATVLDEAELQPPPSGPPAVESPIRIVIADDTPDIRLLLRHALSSAQGFDVVGEAENGEVAVRLAEEQQPDVVLLDLGMPVMDGLQAIPLIRVAAPSARIVVLSGYGEAEAGREAKAAGAAAYIEKGGRTADLVARLRELVPERAPPDAIPPPTLEERIAAGSKLELLTTTYAHELRTLLTVVQGLSDTLRAGLDRLPSPVVRELLESLSRNASQMNALINAFGDARRVGADELELVVEDVDIARLVRRTVADLRELTSGREVAVDGPDRLVVEGDPMRLHQIFTNLISNATKFSPSGTPIRLKIAQRGHAAEVAVVDHGTGIRADEAGQVFERFARLDQRAKGMGLGLYIARGIARAHGGDVELTRSDETGSTFTVRIPNHIASGSRRRSAGNAS